MPIFKPNQLPQINFQRYETDRNFNHLCEIGVKEGNGDITSDTERP